MKTLRELLDASAALHRHLCPRQVLGVRMGLLAGEVLGLALPQTDKRLLTIAETNGCAVDGLSVATGCWVGRRTLRIEDFGKVAATFVDTHTGRAVRIAPRAGCRERARDYAPEARNRWEAQLLGYQRMPNEALLSVQSVQLKVPVAQLISRPGVRTLCDLCGEEIMNKREIVREGQVLCRACAGESYYLLTADFAACAGWASEVRLAAAPFIPQTSPLQRGVHAKVVREQAAPSTAASLRSASAQGAADMFCVHTQKGGFTAEFAEHAER